MLLGTSIYAGGDGEEKLLNTNSCVNCGLSVMRGWKRPTFEKQISAVQNLEMLDFPIQTPTGSVSENLS